MQISGSIRCCFLNSADVTGAFMGDHAYQGPSSGTRRRARRSCGIDSDVLEVTALIVDADFGWRNPAREPTAVPARLHQALNESPIVVGRKPLAAAVLPLTRRQELSVGRSLDIFELTNEAVEGNVRQFRSEER